MKARFIIFVLLATIGFASCTSSYYVTGQGSSGRHQGYKRGDSYNDRYGDYHRGHWHDRSSRGNWRYRRW